MRPPQAIDLAVYARGFELSRERFEGAGNVWETGFHALLEIVAWAGALRERIGRNRVQSECPELEGLYWVRNLMVHVGSDALVNAIATHGTVLGEWVLGLGVLGDPGSREWRWRPRHELPQPQSPAGADEYDAHLDGQPVVVTLERVSAFLSDEILGSIF